jgi:hypothetical protein
VFSVGGTRTSPTPGTNLSIARKELAGDSFSCHGRGTISNFAIRISVASACRKWCSLASTPTMIAFLKSSCLKKQKGELTGSCCLRDSADNKLNGRNKPNTTLTGSRFERD